MSLSDHFFKGKCCECSIRFVLPWIFFLGAVAVSISILLINSKNIDYGDVNFTVRTLFVITIVIISAIISRFMCYLNSKDDIQKLNTSKNTTWYNNQLMYEEAV